MRFDLITIFPEFFAGPLGHGIVRRAREAGLIDVRVQDLREFTKDRYGVEVLKVEIPINMKFVEGARVFGGGAVGALWFTRDTPVPDSRRFNLTFEYGGGVELPISETRTVVAGYKFHHFSNAYTAPRNPGVDGNVLYLGVMRRR